MGSFLSSFRFVYILVAVNYVSKWIKPNPCQHNDNKTMICFLKQSLLRRFRIHRAVVIDEGKYFCNKSFESLTKKYRITHKAFTLYHLQTNGQIELATRKIKQILKRWLTQTTKNGFFELLMHYGLTVLHLKHL